MALNPENNMDSPYKIDYSAVTPTWSDTHQYSPAPRHRRRLIMKLLDRLDFVDCLDVGCAQPFLITELLKRKNIRVAGCDISEKVILSNEKLFPDNEFFVMDVTKIPTDRKQYDLVICSEVLEHIGDWQLALENINKMCRRWMLITVPAGNVHPIDQRVGHIRHFQGDELISAIAKLGFSPVHVQHWGFPFHSLYKYAINGIAPDKMYRSFAEENYGIGKRFVSMVLYQLFFVNDLFRSGLQFIALLERK